MGNSAQGPEQNHEEDLQRKYLMSYATNIRLKSELEESKNKLARERSLNDGLIQDAKFVSVASAGMVLIGGAAIFLIGWRRFKQLNGVAEGYVSRLQNQEQSKKQMIESLEKSFKINCEAAKAKGSARVATSFLDVADDIDRSIAAFDAQMKHEKAAEIKNVREGLILTQRNLEKAFADHRIRKVDPINELFDPHIHEAVQTKFEEDFPKNSIVEVMQNGYIMGGQDSEDNEANFRVLRPARVTVNMGGREVEQSKDEVEATLTGDDPILEIANSTIEREASMEESK